MIELQELAAKLKEDFYGSTYGVEDITFRNQLTGLISKIESATPNPYIHEKTKGLRRVVRELFTKNRTRKKADELFLQGKSFAYAIEAATHWTGAKK